MVKKLFYFLLAITFLIALYLTIFELLLHSFHAPFNGTIKDPIVHDTTWSYLIEQEYITFIELDLFNIYEKRHLLDVKKVLENSYSLWLYFSSLSLLILTIVIITSKNTLKIVSQYMVNLGIISLLILLGSSFNFLNTFNLFHSFFFTQNSWMFPKESLLIETFPLRYFQEFFLLFLVLTFLVLIFLKFYAKISDENFNNR